ncbi:MAG: hypothetical protein ACRD44_14325 [Bryobacteraceae bacterium]
MKREEAEKLIGGYATGTLTAEEQQSLYSAALRDQELFNALAGEEAVRELLAQPAFRERLLTVLAPNGPGLVERFGAWIMRPVPMGGLAAAMASVLAVVLFLRAPVEAPRELARAKPAAQPAAASTAKAGEPAPANRPQARAADREAAPAGPKLQARVAPRRDFTLEDAPQPMSARPRGREELAEPSTPPPPQPPASTPAPAVVAESRTAAAAASAPALMAKSVEAPFRYRLERRAENESFDTVSPASTFRRGDALRLIVDAVGDGWVQVQIRDGSESRTLFAAPVEPGKRYTIPPAGSLPAEAGDKTLVLHFSRLPMGVGQLTTQSYRQTPAQPGARAVTSAEKDDGRKVNVPDPYTVEIPLRVR